ncbi:hypothetical protein C8R43DRAFT_997206 [Mycena crocata]|nr:hypothetical protein C8R43DRAFT_997206 [Mycena crocata]
MKPIIMAFSVSYPIFIVHHSPQNRSMEAESEPQTPKTPDSLNTRVDSLEINFDGLIKRVDGLRQMLDNMGTEVHGLEGKVDGLEKKFGLRMPPTPTTAVSLTAESGERLKNNCG